MQTRAQGMWEAWVMTAPGAPFERRELPARSPEPGEAMIEVAGCGVCHTDLSFLYHGVKTRGALPLVWATRSAARCGPSGMEWTRRWWDARSSCRPCFPAASATCAAPGTARSAGDR